MDMDIDSSSDNKNELTSFPSFFTVPLFLFKTIGFTPFFNETVIPKRGLLFQFIGILSQLILFVSLFLDAGYVINSENISFIDFTTVCLYIEYGSLSLVKTGVIAWNRKKLSSLVNKLLILHPNTKAKQDFFNVGNTSKNTNLFFKIYAIVYMAMISCFNLYPIVKMFIDFIVNGYLELRLPFLMWFPYNPLTNQSYLPTVVFQFWSAFVAGASLLACDLLLFAVGIQVCMHFISLRNEIESLKSDNETNRKDYYQLTQYIRKHNEIIELSVELDAIFGGSILFHFISSSMIICVVGFLAVISSDFMELVKYILALGSSVIQLFIICWLGDRVMETSKQIGDGAYYCDWINAGTGYKKSIITVIQRGQQRPQYLTAYKFSVASMVTFSSVLSTSWSYFVLLQTVYEP